jgi:beta-N-acetylhexosaminidase
VPRPIQRLGPAALAALALVGLLALPAAGRARPTAGQASTPGVGAGAAVDAQVLARIAGMSLEEKVGQLFVTYAYGRSADEVDPRNRSTYGVDTPVQVVQKYHLGGVIYFAWSNNVDNPPQIAGLSTGLQRAALGDSGVPLLVSTDQEGGIVARVGPPATQFPGNMALGAARQAEYALQAASITAGELRTLGINQDYAPVADVNVNPQNPVIGVRSFGEAPELVSGLVRAQVAGHQQGQRLAATAKHFPGHGDTSVDSHTGLPVIHHSLDELEKIDLPPFQAAIERGIASIMTAHIVVPALDPSGRPATLSRPILTGLLRERLGFDGVIVTDALDMAGVRQMFGDERVPVEALKAGTDMLLMPPVPDLQYHAVLDAVRSGEISEARLDQSLYRILRLKFRLGLFTDPFAHPERIAEVVGTPQHLATADHISDRAVTLLKNDAGLLPLAPGSGKRTLVTGFGVTTTATIGQELAARGLATEVLSTGSNPSDTTIAQAAAAANRNELVVVTTSQAWNQALNPKQKDLVNALLQTGRPLIALAVREPYDIAYFTAASTYLVVYGFNPVSLRALVRVLFGEVNPSGKPPVTILAADDPARVLFPYGFGLSYDR